MEVRRGGVEQGGSVGGGRPRTGGGAHQRDGQGLAGIGQDAVVGPGDGIAQRVEELFNDISDSLVHEAL